MLFSPRHPPAMSERLRVALWPRRSFARSVRYVVCRIVRLAGSPHGLAIGVAAGVFIATLPLPGLQMVLAAALAWIIGGNVPAALLGTFWANPLTLPALWFSSHWIGLKLSGGGVALDINTALSQVSRLDAAFWPALKPMMLGSVVLGSASACLFYAMTKHVITGYREGRRSPESNGEIALLRLSGASQA